MRANLSKWLVDAQIRALKHALSVPNASKRILTLTSNSNCPRPKRKRSSCATDHFPGQCYAECSVKTETLAHKLGQVLATTAKALSDFHDDHLKRDFTDLMQGDWIRDHLDAVRDDNRRKLISTSWRSLPVGKWLNTLDMQVVHNDANDYNILVKGTPRNRGNIWTDRLWRYVHSTPRLRSGNCRCHIA